MRDLFDYDEDDDPDVSGMVRSDDYGTSIEAAVAVAPHLTELQGRVETAYGELGPMSDDPLERLPQFGAYAYSTVRKRRTELVQLGILVPVGTAINSRGRRMMVWALRADCVESEPGVWVYVGRIANR